MSTVSIRVNIKFDVDNAEAVRHPKSLLLVVFICLICMLKVF